MARNLKTRPLSWKIARNTQLASAIKTGGWQVAWVWVNIIASVDHFGRMEGGAYALRDMFFDNMPDVFPEEVEGYLVAIENVGLIFRYGCRKQFLQCPKIGVYQKLSGNLSPISDYPEPTIDDIKEWKGRFNEEYVPLLVKKVKRGKAQKTDSIEEIGEYWNSKHGLSKINHWNHERIEKTKQRLQSDAFKVNWRKAIDKIATSTFCCGGGTTGWRASFDWFIRNDMNWIKAVEGKYDDRKKGSSFDDILKSM